MSMLKAFTLLAVAVLSTAALADPPARVGRVASTQGQVTVRSGDEANDALLNWPITTGNRLTTGSGAMAEWRVGSAAVRLAGGSELEVSELDDDSFRLRLNYGSVSVRIRNPDMLRDFELSTAQVRVVLRQPGQVRIDTERVPDANVVSVLAGTAQIDGGGASLTLPAGRQAEIRDGDVRTSALLRDRFDDWPEAPMAARRYVSDQVTGYEELDQYGSWSDSAEYGLLWQPRGLPLDWAPYHDGRWIWLAPWGWTWVDNAPWGYAPSHYGRWVLVDRRWRWTPGQLASRPVWAPALVGWVGGDQSQATFASRGVRHTAPAVGWFPLAPRDAYVPAYRASPEYQRRINADHDGARRGNDNQRQAREHQPLPIQSPAPVPVVPALRSGASEAMQPQPQVVAPRQPIFPAQQLERVQRQHQQEAAQVQRQQEAAQVQRQQQGAQRQHQQEAAQAQRQQEGVQRQHQQDAAQAQRQQEGAQRQHQQEGTQRQRQQEAAQRNEQRKAGPDTGPDGGR